MPPLWLGSAGQRLLGVQEVASHNTSSSRVRVMSQRPSALGSLATLVIVFVLSRVALGFLLREQADSAIRAAIFIADLVVSPLLFLGAALLYFDQAARVSSSSSRKRSAGRVNGTSRA